MVKREPEFLRLDQNIMRSIQTQNISRTSPVRARCWLIVCVVFSLSSFAQQPPASTQLPTGGRVVAGQVGIQQSGASMNVTQTSTRGVVDWATFNVGSSAQVKFIQPSANAVTLNRVLDSNPSQIFGKISSNGQVFLTNPNGLFFSPISSVDVGGLVATTMKIGTDDFMAGINRFKSADGLGLVVNQGRLTASDGGYISLLAPQVRNEGVIIARLGSVALASGNAVTLQLSDRSLVKVHVEEGAINGLIENKSLVKADGGLVVMTAKAANALAESVIQNSGTIQAQTIENQSGRILLIGDMSSGKLNADGTLDASAPVKGDGGFIETSAAKVKIANSTVVTTKAQQGKTGKWLVDPHDYTVAVSGGDQTGAQLSASLETTNVELQSSAGSQTGLGDVNINDRVTWSQNNTLTLTASNNVNVNENILATGVGAGLVINPNTTNNLESASNSGVFNLRIGASIKLPNVLATANNAFILSGVSYTVINSLGAQGSISGLDLQGMNGNLSGNYVLGGNVSLPDTWEFKPIGLGGGGYVDLSSAWLNPVGFSGRLNGLGNHVVGSIDKSVGRYGFVGLFAQINSSSTVENINLLVSAKGERFVGSLAGVNYGTIKNIAATGSVYGLEDIGGVIGYDQNSKLINIFSKVAVSSGNNPSRIGGVIGAGVGGDYSGLHWDGSMYLGLGVQSVGGLIGEAGGISLKDSYAKSYINFKGGNNVGGLIGNSTVFGASSISESGSSGSLIVSGGDASQNIGGLIGTIAIGSVSNSSSDMYIYLNDVKSFGGFVGSNYSAITNAISNSVIEVAGNMISGIDQLNYGGGGFAGYSQGSISNSISKGAITINGTSSQVGGFVGLGKLTVDQSYSSVDVNLNGSARYSGGFVGNTRDFVANNTYSTGLISVVSSTGAIFIGGYAGNLYSAGTSVSNSYSSGAVSVQNTLHSVAGFTGGVEGGATISNSFWDIERSGYSVGARSPFSNNELALPGLSGLLSNQMTDWTNFSSKGWNLGIWAILPSFNNGSPYISQKLIYAKASAVDKVYGDSSNISYKYYDSFNGGTEVLCLDCAGNSSYGVDGGGLALTRVNGLRAYAPVEAYKVRYLDGMSSAVYSIVQGNSTDYFVSRKDLQVVGLTAQNKMYDATRTAALTGAAAVMALGADEVTVGGAGAGLFADKNVGATKAVAVTGYTISGADAGNYNLVQPVGVFADITKADLQLTGVGAQNKVYDTTRTAALTGTAAVVVLGADDVSVGGTGAGQFADKNVGTGKAVSVTGYTISGTDADNYNVVQPVGVAADITKADLQVTGVGAQNKVYDTTRTAALSGTAAVAVLGADDVTLGGVGAGLFSDKSAGTSKAVSVTGYTVSGTDAGNYNVLQPTGVAADITKADLQVTGVGAQNKVYDATRTATVTGTAAVAALGADDVTLGGTAAGVFADKNVGTAKAVAVTGYTISGTDADNYNVVQPVGVAADITKADLQVAGVGAQNKVYDTTRTATLTGTAVVAASGTDDVTVGGTGAGLFVDKNVGTSKAVSATGYTISGTDAGNYNVLQPTGVAADITKADLQVTGVGAQNKVYDATRTATVTGTAAVAALGADDVTLGGTAAGVFADKNVGTAKAVAVTGYTISGTDADNYNVVQPVGVAADITKADLQVAGVGAQNKVYDTTRTATLTGAATVAALGADDVTVGGTGAGLFADKNVGTAKAVAVTGYTLNGPDAGNYNLKPPVVRASIIPTDERIGLPPPVIKSEIETSTQLTLLSSVDKVEVKIGLDRLTDQSIVSLDLSNILKSYLPILGGVTLTGVDGKPIPSSLNFDEKNQKIRFNSTVLNEPVMLVFTARDQVLTVTIFQK